MIRFLGCCRANLIGFGTPGQVKEVSVELCAFFEELCDTTR
jgi:hypothetical protein